MIDLLTLSPQARVEDGVPGVTTRWTGVAGLLLNYSLQSPTDADGMPLGLLEFLTTLDPDRFDLLPAMRLPTAIVTSVGVMVIYLLARRLFGDVAGLVAGVLLALEPFYIGLSQIIHQDALTASFIGVAVLSLLAYLTEKRFSTWLLLLASVATSLAWLSKLTALFLLPYTIFVAAALCLRWDARPRLDLALVRRTLIRLTAWGGLAVLVVLVLWPALWTDPQGVFGQVFFVGGYFATTPHEAGSYFLGQQVDDPGIFFYPVVFLFHATPLMLFGLLATLPLFRGRVERESSPYPRFYLFALWAFALLFMIFIGLGAKKIDRYALPTLLIADVLAGVGVAYLLDLLRRVLSRWEPFTTLRTRQFVAGLIVALVLVLQAGLLWSHVPYYSAYFNPLLGGTRGAVAAIPVGWGESCDQVNRYLNSKANAAELDAATSHVGSCLGSMFKGTAWSLYTASLSERAGLPWYAADYVVIHINQVQRYKPNRAFIEFFQTQTPEYVVCIDGLEQAWIYPMPATFPADVLPASRCPIHKVTANFEDQVRLGNYAWGDADFQRKDEFAAGETVYLALRWRTDHPLPAQYKVFVHVYDSQGRRVAQADELLGGRGKKDEGPKLQTQPSQQIMNYLELPIPPATPPGNYAVVVGLYDVATGRRLSLLNAAGQATGTVFHLGILPVARPATPPAVADLPIQHPLAVEFPAGLALLGYDLQPAEGRAGEPLTVALYWQAQRDPLADLTVELQLRDAAGRVWAKHMGPPADGTYPTSRWMTGEIVRDVHDLTVDAATPPEAMRLVLALHTANPWIPAREVVLTNVPIVGRQHQFTAPAVAYSQVADLTGVRFLGYDLADTTARVGEPLTLTLHWQALDRMKTSYKLFVHLVDEGYQPWGQVDRLPCDGACPTTGWLPGEYLTETYSLVPRPGTPPGTYRIVVGLYDEQTGVRLPRADGTGDHILLDAVITVQ